MSSIHTPPEASSLEDRVATATMVAWGRHGYLTEDGEPDLNHVTDLIYELVSKAEAKKKIERAKVGITRRALMEAVFPKVMGPEGWAEEDDPEVSEGVYKSLDSTCWRLTNTSPNGPIQSRLNSDHGVVLCRTKVNPHRTDAVYVTRDLGCLLEDIIKPQRDNQKKRADRDAAFTAMLIERVPEHGTRFNRELVGGLRTALSSAQAIVAGALEASQVDDDDDDDDLGVGDVDDLR